MKSTIKRTICISIFLITILFNIKVIAIEEDIEDIIVDENANTNEATTIEDKKTNTDEETTMEDETTNTDKENTTEKKEEPPQIIEDGTYVIRSAINPKFVLDVYGALQGNGTNLQLYEYTADPQKRFKVKYLGDGYYSIIAEHSNKALDVKYASKSKGANVWQWEENGTDAQKWLIKDAGDGYYSIISKCNGLYVDVLNANASNYTNIQMCDGNGLKAQKFKFEKVKEDSNSNVGDSSDVVQGAQTIEDGTYVIRSAINPKFVLDVYGALQGNGTNVQLYEYTSDPQKRFKVKYLGDGYYNIIAEHSNKALDVKDASKQKGANVWQWEQNGTDAQKWLIKDVGDGYYSIISKCNGLYVDVLNANANNYTNIQMCDGNGLKAQKFIFKRVNEILYSSGTYGKSGLAIKGDSRGTDLRYYKFGEGKNVMFATFSIHGFEDSYDHDGSELTYIAEKFKSYLLSMQDIEILKKWTIYIFPTLNPDGQTYGTTNNGEGRTTLYSAAPSHKGIDMNRNFQTSDYATYKDDRNYNGTAAFQAYEARYLRDFLLNNKSQNGQTILIDLHGWLDETMGDDELGAFYRKQIGMQKHIVTYGRGYLINWARMSLGNSNKVARTALIELPQVTSHEELVDKKYAEKYIDATIDMLKTIK